MTAIGQSVVGMLGERHILGHRGAGLTRPIVEESLRARSGRRTEVANELPYAGIEEGISPGPSLVMVGAKEAHESGWSSGHGRR